MTDTLPEVTVVAYFDFPFSAPAFTLDDPTKGKLDDVTYTLFASTPVTLASSAQLTNIRRGTTSRLVPEAEVGTATITLFNMDRTFDPTYSSGPYFGNLIPGRRVTVFLESREIFDGRIEDIDLNYELSGMSTTVLKLTDGLAILGRQEFDDWTATAGQTAGERLGDVFDRPEVQWPAARRLDDGVSVLQGDTVTWGTNVLNYCQTVARSDLGSLYVNRFGEIVFKDRHSTLNTGPYAVFSDDGTRIPYQRIEAAYGSELLFNRVSVARVGGAEQTVLDLDAQLSYGVRTTSLSGLLVDSNEQALDIANYLLGRYSDPEFRITSIEVNMAALTYSQRLQMADLDISQTVSVSFTPNDIGSAIQQNCLITGIEHNVTPGSHLMTLHLINADRTEAFTLDSTLFGVLDTSVLTF